MPPPTNAGTSVVHDTAAAGAAPFEDGALLRVALIGDLGAAAGSSDPLALRVQEHGLAQLARALTRRGVAVDLFTWHEAAEQHRIIRRLDGARIIHMPAGPQSGLCGDAVLARLDPFARFVTRFARRQAALYDLVHATCPGSGMVALHLKKALGLPFVLDSRALTAHHRRPQATASAVAAHLSIEGALVREASRILANNPQEQSEIAQLYGAAPERIAVVPAGYAPEELWPVATSDARHGLGLPQERFTVLHLGLMAPRKGADTVIQGVAMLRKRHGVDAGLVIAGGEPGERGIPELARLRQLAAELGIAAHVRFAGAVGRHALRDYYNAADVFASTPWYARSGRAVLEAMACARPVIGAEVGGIRSLVDDGVTGYLIPSRDAEALAERLARLQRRPALARAMGQAGQQRASEQHSWERVAQLVLDAYGTVLDTSRAHLWSIRIPSQESA